MAELGYPPDRIAELLGIDPARLADFLGRIGPDGRVRPRPQIRAVDEWGYRDVAGDDDLAEVAPPVAAPIAPERQRPGLEVFTPPPPPDPSDWEPHYGTAFRRGSAHGRSALDEACAAEMRELAGDLTREELATWFDCAVSTVGRVLAARHIPTRPRRRSRSRIRRHPSRSRSSPCRRRRRTRRTGHIATRPPATSRSRCSSRRRHPSRPPSWWSSIRRRCPDRGKAGPDLGMDRGPPNSAA